MHTIPNLGNSRKQKGHGSYGALHNTVPNVARIAYSSMEPSRGYLWISRLILPPSLQILCHVLGLQIACLSTGMLRRLGSQPGPSNVVSCWVGNLFGLVRMYIMKPQTETTWQKVQVPESGVLGPNHIDNSLYRNPESSWDWCRALEGPGRDALSEGCDISSK